MQPEIDLGPVELKTFGLMFALGWVAAGAIVSRRMRELDPAEAIARLFRCAFPLFYDGESLDFTLAFLARLVASVPVRELQFILDRSVVDLVLAA